ncbi:MAG: SGNH/GDSL hydrolase family protein [Myxococcota bacterium]
MVLLNALGFGGWIDQAIKAAQAGQAQAQSPTTTPAPTTTPPPAAPANDRDIDKMEKKPGAKAVTNPFAAADVSNGYFGPGKKAVFIGDSHTEPGPSRFPFGKRMEEDMKATGTDVTTVAHSGASPWHYTKGGKYNAELVKALQQQPPPDTVVIALGTNFKTDAENSAGSARADVKMITDEVKKYAPNAKIVWVGRPLENTDKGKGEELVGKFNKNMEAAAAKAGVAYVSSLDGTRVDPNKELPKGYYSGEHIRNKAAGERWADSVMQKILDLKP